MKKKFNENLRLARNGVGLTQKQVADKLGVVESCYAKWEQGRAEPNIENLIKLCEIFDISLDDLING